MDRVWVAGVRPSDVILAHVATQFLVLAGQITLVLFFTQVVFKLPQEGPFILIILLLLLLGISGMSRESVSDRSAAGLRDNRSGRFVVGLVISTQAEDEVSAM